MADSPKIGSVGLLETEDFFFSALCILFFGLKVGYFDFVKNILNSSIVYVRVHHVVLGGANEGILKSRPLQIGEIADFHAEYRGRILPYMSRSPLL